MTDLTKLKELAERALALHGTPSLEHVFAITKFREALEPKAILGLIAEVERLRGDLPRLVSYAEDMSTCTLTMNDGNGYFYNRVTDKELSELDALTQEVAWLRKRLEIDDHTPYDGIACRDETIKGLDEKCDRLKRQVDMLINQHMPREPIPDMPGWSRVVDAERLVAENKVLRSALQAVQGEVDGNIRPLTRDLVNMVSGVKNGSHPNEIYDHCDEIDRIIDAALEGGGR